MAVVWMAIVPIAPFFCPQIPSHSLVQNFGCCFNWKASARNGSPEEGPRFFCGSLRQQLSTAHCCWQVNSLPVLVLSALNLRLFVTVLNEVALLFFVPKDPADCRSSIDLGSSHVSQSDLYCFFFSFLISLGLAIFLSLRALLNERERLACVRSAHPVGVGACITNGTSYSMPRLGLSMPRQVPILPFLTTS